MFTVRSTIAALVAAGCMTGLASAQIEAAAQKAIEEARTAMQSAKDVSFKAKRSATGMLASIINADGEVKMVTDPATKTRHGRVSARFKTPGGADQIVETFSDQANIDWLDYTQNKMFRRPVSDPAARSMLNMAQQIMISEWTAKDAFNREIGPTAKAKALRLDGVENIRGSVCDKIVAEFENSRSVIWYIDTVDRLPRKKVDLTAEPGKPTFEFIIEMWDFQTNQGLKVDDVRMTLPSGFAMDAPVPTPMAQDVPAQPPALGPKAGEPAPAFELKDSAGKDVTLAGLKGNVVVMYFFGTWNAPSMRGATELQAIADQFKDKPVKVLGLACGETDAEAAKKAVSDAKLSFDVLMDCDSVQTQYLVQGVPSYCIVDKDGKVLTFFQSQTPREKIVEAIEGALK